MSSNKTNNSVHSYLKSASLFRNQKKELYNSSYVTHNRYFDDQNRSSSNMSNSTAIKMPNITHIKKQSHFPHQIEREQNQLRISQQLSSREEEQIFQKQLQIFGSILASKEIEKDKFPANNSQEKPFAFHQTKSQKIDENILTESLRGSKKEVSKDIKKEILSESKKQLSKQISNKSIKSMKVIIKPANNQIKQEIEEKSFCEKIEVGTETERDYYEGKRSTDYINPYEPINDRKKKQVEYQEDPHQLTMKKMVYQQSHTISSIQPIRNQREGIYIANSSAVSKLEGDNSQDNLLNVRKEISTYLTSLKLKLQGSFICLETLQGQFDIIMNKTLQMQSERLKVYLFKLIEQQVSNLREFQKKEILRNKFYFMSQLYEMKCNIQLRSEQIENLQSLIKDDYRWKQSIHTAISNNYSEGINSIILKSEQIQSELAAQLDINLAHYTQTSNKELITCLKSVISDQFYNYREKMNRSKQKGHRAKEKE